MPKNPIGNGVPLPVLSLFAMFDSISAVSGTVAPPPTGAEPESMEGSAGAPEQLSKEEQQEVAKLKQRDAEVRAHEQAHIAAGGHYVRGGANYEYQTGPDGKRYAVGGEVSIDTSPVPDDPQATITKMQTVRRAALAPAKPEVP